MCNVSTAEAVTAFLFGMLLGAIPAIPLLIFLWKTGYFPKENCGICFPCRLRKTIALAFVFCVSELYELHMTDLREDPDVADNS